MGRLFFLAQSYFLIGAKKKNMKKISNFQKHVSSTTGPISFQCGM